MGERESETNPSNSDELSRRSVQGTSRRGFLRGTAGIGAVVAGAGVFGSRVASATSHPPKLRRDGNRIETESGQQVTLHGVNIADPKRVDVTAPARGKTAVQAIDLATDESRGWYADVIRLPVQPVDIGEHEAGAGPKPPAFDESQLESYLENHLDAAVEKCAQEGVYAIVDYHRHRDIPWNDEALSDEVQMFWEIVADRYADRPHVIFEMYNEPQGNPNYGVSGQDLVDYWLRYKETAQPWVDTIRSKADNLTLVGSPRWSQLTFGAVIEEFEGADLGYTLHLYPGHAPKTPADYDDFVTPLNYGGGDVPYDDQTPAWEVAPVFMTEYGWDPDASNPVGSVDEATADSADWAQYDPNYGRHVTNWLRTRPVHSTAWVFDTHWDSNMFERGFDTEGKDWGQPYGEEKPVPQLCDDLPCEWTLTEGDYMGQTIKEFLQPASVATLSGEFGPPQDADGDGLMEDVDGDGTVDDDWQALLDHRRSDTVENNVGSFDFDADGSVDLGDVVELFWESHR